MKRIMIFVMFATALVLAACGNSDDAKDKNGKSGEQTNEEQNVKADKENSEKKDSAKDAAEQGDPEGAIKIHVLKADEEAGATIENHPAYSAVADFAKQHPDFGGKDDYSVAVVDATKPKDGKSDLLLIGVNRMGKPIGEVTFRISIGDKKGHTVLDDRSVEIPADAMGALPPGFGHPILVPITEEELDNLNSLDGSTQFVDMKDTKVSEAKE